jgi:uncharacterized protein YdcH (DUF465 family)
MKQLITLIIIFFLGLSLCVDTTYAISPTSTTDQTTTRKLDKQINQLKDKIASRVSELNLVEKRGIIGAVTEAKSNQITITDLTGTPRFVDVDEITKFSSSSNKALGISDLTKGTKISVLGTYNKQSKRILARFINTHAFPTRYIGIIADIDTKNRQFTLITEKNQNVKIDVENATKISAYASDDTTTKLVFSKLKAGDTVFLIGYPDKKETTMLVADRIIALQNMQKNPNIVVAQPTTAPTIEPTAVGAKSIKPIE